MRRWTTEHKQHLYSPPQSDPLIVLLINSAEAFAIFVGPFAQESSWTGSCRLDSVRTWIIVLLGPLCREVAATKYSYALDKEIVEGF
jgi:hypothetical protein